MTFVASKVITFGATLILARLLAPSQFGLLAAVLAFITLLELISDLGMKATVIYESEKGVTSRVQTAFTLNVIFTLALTALAVLVAPLVARYFGAEAHTWLFRIASLDLLVTGLGNINDGLLLRDMEFRRRMIPLLTSNVVRGLATIALAVAGLGASALVIGFIIGSTAWTINLWIVKPFRPTFTIDRTAVRGVAVYGGWASTLELIAAVAQRVDVFVIGRALGSRALGLYTVAQRVPELIVGNVAWNLSIVAFPALSQRREQGHAELTGTTLNLIRYSALFGLPVGVGLAVVAQPLVVVLFSAKWAAAGGIMAALAITEGVVCIVFPLGDTFKALGRQPTMVAVNLIFLPLLIAAMVIAAPAGITAAVWARTAVVLVQALVWLLLITRVLNLSLSRVGAMLGPASSAAAGVALAGGAVRLALPSDTIGPLLLATLAMGVGGAVFLRIFAMREYTELRNVVHQRLGGLPGVPARWRPSPLIASVDLEQGIEESGKEAALALEGDEPRSR